MLKRMGLGLFVLDVQDLIYTLPAARPLFDESVQKFDRLDKSLEVSPLYCSKIMGNSTTNETVAADYFFLC